MDDVCRSWMDGMIRFLARIVVRIFFRRVTLSGTPYVGPGSLWAGNHTSGIMDPALVLALVPVPVRPIAKHTLWNHPVMNPILKLVRAIPIYRMQDMKKELKAEVDGSSNSGAFSAVTEALHQGDHVLIFPEGVSHDDPFIHKLKTGVARMAAQAVHAHNEPDFPVVIQPFTIDYFEKDEFRSDVAIHFGEPIVVNRDFADVKNVMKRLTDSLNDAYASFFSWDEKRNWLFLYELIHGEPPYSAYQFGQFVERYRAQFDEEPILLARLQTFRRMTTVMGLGAQQLSWALDHEKKRSYFKLIFTQTWFHICIALPFSLVAGVFWYLPYQLTRRLALMSTKDRDVMATMKMAHGAWIFPIWATSLATPISYFMSLYFVQIHFVFLWLASLVLGPLILVVSTIANEYSNFLPGYWRLVRLRLFFPRAWNEMIYEWRDIHQACMERLKLRLTGEHAREIQTKLSS